MCDCKLTGVIACVSTADRYTANAYRLAVSYVLISESRRSISVGNSVAAYMIVAKGYCGGGVAVGARNGDRV